MHLNCMDFKNLCFELLSIDSYAFLFIIVDREKAVLILPPHPRDCLAAGGSSCEKYLYDYQNFRLRPSVAFSLVASGHWLDENIC